MDKWKGKYALVTGAAMGIGAAISSALLEHGVNVIGCGRNEFRLKAFAKNCKGPGQFVAVRCDIAQESEIHHMIQVIKQNYGTVDILINNAGMNTGASLLDGKTDDWGIVFDINVIGTCTITREIINLMREARIRMGYVINVSAVQSNVVTPMATMHMYTASKHALQAITHGLRLELKEAGLPIKTTMLSPSVTDKRSSFVSRSPEDQGGQAKGDDEEDPLHADDIADNVIRLLAQADYGRDLGDITFTPTPKKSLLRRQLEKKANEEETRRIATELLSRMSMQYAEELGEVGEIKFVASPSKVTQSQVQVVEAPPSQNNIQRRSHRRSTGARTPEPRSPGPRSPAHSNGSRNGFKTPEPVESAL